MNMTTSDQADQERGLPPGLRLPGSGALRRSKLLHYLRHLLIYLAPRGRYRRRLGAMLRAAGTQDSAEVEGRVNYYNKLAEPFALGPDAAPFRASPFMRRRNYYMDLYAYTRYFDPSLRLYYVFGDVWEVPERPSIVKARPIEGDNARSVLFNLNKVRHFVFVSDAKPFASKLDKLVWRGNAFQENRRRFLSQYFAHPLCDVGHAHDSEPDNPWRRPPLTIREQLRHKFVLSMEGNDVATNLKWIMASNSLCFMAKPRRESWFMEGRLAPDHHYVLLRDDYSDLPDKMKHYSANTAEALRIVANAHRYVAQFGDPAREDLVSLLVLKKYFDLSGQGAER